MMTYGWAILVLMIVGVALWQMHVFDPPAQAPGCTGFSQLIPLDTQLDATTNHELTIVLSNDAGSKMTLNSVEATIGTETGTDATVVSLRAGATTQVSIGPNVFMKPISGGDYRATIVIDYTNVQSGITHKSTGECWGTAE
jgi:hypothetical protein